MMALGICISSPEIDKKSGFFKKPLFIEVIRLGLEPKTPTLKVLCSTC